MSRSPSPKQITVYTLVALAIWAALCVGGGKLREHQEVTQYKNSVLEEAYRYAEEQSELFNAEVDKLRIYPRILANQSDIKQVLHHYDLESPSSDPAEHPRTLASDKLSRLNLYLEKLADELNVSSMFLINRDGYLLASSKWKQLDYSNLNNYGYRLYFKEAMAGRSGEMFAIGANSGEAGYFFSYPVETDLEGIAGVVVIKVESKALSMVLRNTSGITFISDINDVVMLSNMPGFFLKHIGRDVFRLSAKQQQRLYSTTEFVDVGIEFNEQFDETASLVTLNTGRKAGQYVHIAMPIDQAGWNIHSLEPLMRIEEIRRDNLLLFCLIYFAGMLVLYLLQHIIKQMLAAREMARRDPLTGQFNRYYMEAAIQPLLAIHDRTGLSGLSVLMVDIDNFKQINDTHGHNTGDIALKSVAGILHSEARKSDIVCRLGGDEFVMIMFDQSFSGAQAAAKRIMGKVYTVSSVPALSSDSLTISIGLTMRIRGESLDQVMQRADKLLYQAKNQGRNRIVAEEPELDTGEDEFDQSATG